MGIQLDGLEQVVKTGEECRVILTTGNSMRCRLLGWNVGGLGLSYPKMPRVRQGPALIAPNHALVPTPAMVVQPQGRVFVPWHMIAQVTPLDEEGGEG